MAGLCEGDNEPLGSLKEEEEEEEEKEEEGKYKKNIMTKQIIQGEQGEDKDNKAVKKKSGRTREQRIFSKSTSGRGDVTRCMCLYKQFRNYESVPYLFLADQR
ncbi:hypothetical protein ANN_23481 [Periplaneta americana]|uniref:Uncharacterized protein n=1 Tax=Periplaneta americana TaxID=6978 RepID=A0ABQ8SNA2_PERAM|nr:hypothetical protein ANN_23481 [Periplaneta americana]